MKSENAQAKWYLVAPDGVHRCRSMESGLRAARRHEADARRRHGPQAGADCWVVRRQGDELTCGDGDGGLCCGRTFLTVGCDNAVTRVRTYTEQITIWVHAPGTRKAGQRYAEHHGPGECVSRDVATRIRATRADLETLANLYSDRGIPSNTPWHWQVAESIREALRCGTPSR